MTNKAKQIKVGSFEIEEGDWEGKKQYAIFKQGKYTGMTLNTKKECKEAIKQGRV